MRSGRQSRPRKFTAGSGCKWLKNGYEEKVPSRIHPVIDRNAQIQPPRNLTEGGSARFMWSRGAGLESGLRYQPRAGPPSSGTRPGLCAYRPAGRDWELASSFALRAMEDRSAICHLSLATCHLSLVTCHLSLVPGTGYFNGLRNLYSANASIALLISY